MGSGNPYITEFCDSDNETKRKGSAASRYRSISPKKSSLSLSNRRPVAQKNKQKSSIGVFNRTIVQRFMHNPALYMNRKFNIRVFMVILCCKPFVVLASPGYARVSYEEFTLEDLERVIIHASSDKGNLSSLQVKMVHDTKLSVQKRHPKYKYNKQMTTISMKDLKNDLIA